MSLDRYINSLRKPDQFQVAIKLIRLAMPIWEEYVIAEDQKEAEYIFYYGSAVGNKYHVHQQLLQRTVDEVEKYVYANFDPAAYGARKFENLKEEWWSAIRGLEWEEDWYVKEEVKLLIFAVHNLLEAAMGKNQTTFKESFIYVTVNQSIDSLTCSKRMTLEEAQKYIGLITD